MRIICGWLRFLFDVFKIINFFFPSLSHSGSGINVFWVCACVLRSCSQVGLCEFDFGRVVLNIGRARSSSGFRGILSMRSDPNAFYSVIMTIVVAAMSRLLGYTPPLKSSRPTTIISACSVRFSFIGFPIP